MKAPKFNVKSSLSDEDFAKEMQKASRGKRFTPGNYRVMIADIRYHERKDDSGKPSGKITARKDESWILVSTLLRSADGREKKNIVLVPTQDIKYVSAPGKFTMFPFLNLQKFMAAFGVNLNKDNVGDICAEYFSPAGMEKYFQGRECDIVVSYPPNYIAYVDDKQFKLVIGGEDYLVKGELKTFYDRTTAKLYAASELNKTVDEYVDARFEFLPAEAQETPVEESKVAEGWD